MILLLLIVLLAAPAYAAPGIAVVQSAAPTSNGGTQDFISSGFGTPVCALFFGGYGTANGTAVNHAGLWIGFSDFTNEESIGHAAEDTASTTDTGASTGSTALRTLLSTDQTVDGTAAASTITDGARLTWADAPPSAYLMTVVLINAAVASNCAVGALAMNTTQDGTASVSGLGWQPDVILGFSRNNAATNARTSFGMAINDGGIVQYAGGQNDNNGVGTSAITSVLRNDRIVLNPSSTGASSCEITSFDSGGFTCTSRDASSTNTLHYLALKLASGVSAKLLSCTSPTSTGSHSCTGTGWTPQAGIMLHTIVPGLGTYYTADTDNEAYGLSAFTGTASSSSSIMSDDGVAAANTESITDNKPVRLRKDAANFMTATSTGPNADGWNFNYTTTNGTGRYRVVLFFQGTKSIRRSVVVLP